MPDPWQLPSATVLQEFSITLKEANKYLSHSTTRKTEALQVLLPMETSSRKGKMCVICKKKLNSAAPEAAGSADVKAPNRSQALCPICKAHIPSPRGSMAQSAVPHRPAEPPLPQRPHCSQLCGEPDGGCWAPYCACKEEEVGKRGETQRALCEGSETLRSLGSHGIRWKLHPSGDRCETT